MQQANGGLCSNYFYPRPPRGGRPVQCDLIFCRVCISIHALREEGDCPQRASPPQPFDFYPRPPRGGRLGLKPPDAQWYKFLSTPSARRATDTESYFRAHSDISIHALREEGDSAFAVFTLLWLLFLSTPSARRATKQSGQQDRANVISIHALREEGDGIASLMYPVSVSFLSTPSARRATARIQKNRRRRSNFYPRPPRGGRQQKQRENTLLLSHYTPLCTNCKEMSANQTAKSHRYSRKRLVFRCEASRKTMCAAGSHWPDIKRSARCLGQILGAVQRARPSSGSCCPAGRTADCPRRGRSGRSALL